MNIYDIAKKAGVSTATVSRVINKTGNVSESTRLKVEKVIRDSNYIPNDIARSLASNSTKSIAIMVPDIRQFFESHAAYSIEKGLADYGYASILCDTSDKIENKKNYLYLLKQKKVEAIVGVGSTYGEGAFIGDLVRVSEEIPVILLNVSLEKAYKNLVTICSDEMDGMDQGLSFFKQKGYKNPIFISSSSGLNTSSYINKKAGFIESLGKFFPGKDFIEIKLQTDYGDVEKVTEFLKKNPEIDSLQCETDRLALVVFKELTTHKFRIPEDLAMIGYDNIELTNLTEKRITSIDQKIDELADLAVKTTLGLLRGEKVESRVTMKPVLIPKETT